MRLPAVEIYLGRLPDGLGSYPDAKAKATVVRPWLDGSLGVALRGAGGLPAPLVGLIAAPPPVSTWVPEVWLAVLILAASEVHFATDRELQDHIRVTNRAAFRSPLYRILFEVLSPEMLLKGAAQRWSAFHRGSTLKVTESGRRRAVLELRYPPHIFGVPSLRGHGTSFALAAEMAGAEGVKMELEEVGAAQTRYVITWA